MACCQSYPILERITVVPPSLKTLPSYSFGVMSYLPEFGCTPEAHFPCMETLTLIHTPTYMQQRERTVNSRDSAHHSFLFVFPSPILQNGCWTEDVQLLFPPWAPVPNYMTTFITFGPFKITERDSIKIDFGVGRIALKIPSLPLQML